MELLVFEVVKSFIVGMIIALKNPVAVLVLVVCVLLRIFYPRLRGLMGEFWVRLELEKLSKSQYLVLNDIMIESSFGTHQIDHLVISEYGIFVIEVKNYYGLIIGEDFNDKWLQILGKNKYYFKNPINQNYGHVKALQELLELDKSVFISVVCFSNSAKLKIKSRNIIVQLDNLVKTIKKFYKPLLDVNLDEIGKVIIANNITDLEKRRSHVKSIKYKMAQDDIKSNNMICPKCGNKLLLRNGKYGTFIGCSNYPKCKYTKN